MKPRFTLASSVQPTAPECARKRQASHVSAYTWARPARTAATPGNPSINALSALLALAVGVVDASLAPVVAGGDLRPSLIFAAAVAVTPVSGLAAGTLWALVGGVTVNLLTTDPLGIIPLGLLAAVGLTAGMVRLLGPRTAVIAVAGMAGSVVMDAVAIVGLGLLSDAPAQLPPDRLAAVLVPTAIVNGLLAALLGLFARAMVNRFGTTPNAI